MGIWPAHVWWLNDWHWLGGLLIVIGIGALFGLDAGVLVLASIGLVQFISFLSVSVGFAHVDVAFMSGYSVYLPAHLRIDLLRLLLGLYTLTAMMVVRVLWEWVLAIRGW
jgi:hypothetical protein